MKLIFLLYVQVLAFTHVLAAVKPNSLFADHAVLQQGVKIPVWGTASHNERVTVEFAGQVETTIATGGRWLVHFKAAKASYTPYRMVIRGENEVVINDLLIGEVWLCSGQSNMAFPLRAVKALDGYADVTEVIRDAQRYPAIRQFSIPLKKWENTPGLQDDAQGKWMVCDSMQARNFSAVAYYFARELHNRLRVPVGIINASYGGTAIENWMSRETLQAYPELGSIFTNYEKALADFPAKLAGYRNNEANLLAAYAKDSAEAAKRNTELPRKPAPPMSPAERGGPTGLWNTMIHPLLPYAIKGCLWYQGEANASRGLQYRTLLPAMISNWRAAWGAGDFPFIIIQIPGWKNHYPELREAQWLATQKVPNTSLVVITDCDDTVDVHPGNKEPVGVRASLPARALAYGEGSLEYSGPVYQSMKVDGNKVILSFSHTGSGLAVKNGELKDFVIAGTDKQFVPARAKVYQKNKVMVWADQVANPAAVRMGWRLCPQVNLYNKEGLCAAAFRTDIQ